MSSTLKRPSWFKHIVRKKETEDFVKELAEGEKVFTVCESAKCPNRGECFRNKTLTFMILGGICTRGCKFCAVEGGKPLPIDPKEIPTIVNIVRKLKLKYTVITSVTRDDLPDGGAGHFANIIDTLKNEFDGIKVEVLTPDFKGNTDDLKTVLSAKPYVFNHNIETVPSLYKSVRPQAVYERSLDVLRQAKIIAPDIKTKSGIMLGLGEERGEIIDTLKDIRKTGCNYITIGHYIRPTKKHYPVKKYYETEDFRELRDIALEIGFEYAVSLPLARSSYMAHTYKTK